MTNTRELVKVIRTTILSKEITRNEIKKKMEDMGAIPLSDATFSRLMEEGSEENRHFDFDYTLVPLALALGIDDIDGNDSEQIKAFKEMSHLQEKRISELEMRLEQIEATHAKELLEKMEAFDKEREAWGRSIDFLKEQITLKDARMDMQNDRTNNLLDRIEKKDDQITKLTYDLIEMKEIKDSFDTCPYRNKEKNHE